MAINAATVWEIRAEGVPTNGGGYYNRDPGTSVDYSQQDAAQLALTDLVSDGAGTGITSTTGGFTAAMVGNHIYIAGGTGFTTGWYEIVTYTDTNTIVIDRSAAASKTGGTGNVGGAWNFGSTLDQDFFEDGVAGNVYYIKAGTYSLSENITQSVNGTLAAKFNYIGYNTTRTDEPTGDSRPLIQLGAVSWNTQDWAIWHNIRIVGIGGAITTSNSNKFYGCYFGDQGTTRTSRVVTGSGIGVSFWGCEFEATDQANTEEVIQCFSQPFSFFFCYFHGDDNTKARGVSVPASPSTFFGCVFDTLGYGVHTTGTAGASIINCVFYNCVVGVYQEYWYGAGVTNCIFHSCTTGIEGSAAGEGTETFKCFFYNNSTDITNGVVNRTDTVGTDPLLNDPANGDFSLQSGSLCLDTGCSLNLTNLT